VYLATSTTKKSVCMRMSGCAEKIDFRCRSSLCKCIVQSIRDQYKDER